MGKKSCLQVESHGEGLQMRLAQPLGRERIPLAIAEWLNLVIT